MSRSISSLEQDRERCGAVLACSVTVKIYGERLTMVSPEQNDSFALQRWFSILMFFCQAFSVNYFLSQIVKGQVNPEMSD